MNITAKHLAVRLGTVAREQGCEKGELPLHIRVNGQRHALTIDNFKVDDDGSLMLENELLQPSPLKPLLATLKARLQWYDGVDFVRMADVETAIQESLEVDTNPLWTAVLTERIRQVETYGFIPEEDDGYQAGELAAASISYLEEAFCQVNEPTSEARTDVIPNQWPWPDEAWKPSAEPARNLVKALALGLAELERLARAAAPIAEEPIHG